jgi:hypothetical protein
MNNNKFIALLKRIPEDVVINHIVPYTYKPQKRELLQDIRTYYNDSQILTQWYEYGYNEAICFNVLLRFCNNCIVPIRFNKKWYEIILNRHIMFSNSSSDFLIEYINSHFYFRRNQTISPKIRFIWGLLTPVERTRFINIYILRYDNIE